MANKIYQIQGGKIEVFSFSAIEEKMKKFRKEEMETLPEDERFLLRNDPPSWFRSQKGIVYECGAYVLQKRLDLDCSSEQYSVVEKKFHAGAFLKDPIRILPREDQDDDIIVLHPGRGTSDVRVQLTPDLYLAQLLEREEFSDEDVQSSSLEAVRDLFFISEDPISEISIEEMKKLFDHDLIAGEYSSQIDYIEKAGKVLQKLRS